MTQTLGDLQRDGWTAMRQTICFGELFNNVSWAPRIELHRAFIDEGALVDFMATLEEVS